MSCFLLTAAFFVASGAPPVAQGQEPRTFSGHEEDVGPVAFSADSRRLASAAGTEIKVWDLESGKQAWSANAKTGTGMLAWSPDGKMLVSRGLDTSFWDAATGGEIATIKTGNNPTPLCAFASGGKLLVLDQGEYKVLDVDQRKIVRKITGTGGGSWGVGVNAGILVMSPKRGTMGVFDLATGSQIRSFDVEPGGQPVLSPDGRLLAITQDLSTQLWDVETGKKLRDLAPSKMEGTGGRGTFTSDGKMLCVPDASNKVRLFDVESGKEKKALKTPGMSMDCTLSPDGKVVAWAVEKTVRLLKVE